MAFIRGLGTQLSSAQNDLAESDKEASEVQADLAKIDSDEDEAQAEIKAEDENQAQKEEQCDSEDSSLREAMVSLKTIRAKTESAMAAATASDKEVASVQAEVAKMM